MYVGGGVGGGVVSGLVVPCPALLHSLLLALDVAVDILARIGAKRFSFVQLPVRAVASNAKKELPSVNKRNTRIQLALICHFGSWLCSQLRLLYKEQSLPFISVLDSSKDSSLSYQPPFQLAFPTALVHGTLVNLQLFPVPLPPAASAQATTICNF